MDRARLKLNTQIYEEACTFFLECRAEDLNDAARRDFDRWLRKSPEHLSAYLEVAAIWNEGPGLDTSGKWDSEALIAEAKKDPENVVTLPAGSAVLKLEEAVPEPQALPSPEPRRLFPRRRLLTLAASVAVLATLGALWAYLALTSGLYSTAIGEQRSIELADGSTVSMNSKSRVRVRYSKSERAVELLAGQALFHVAKDPARPFIVSADGTRVRAVGTEFDVNRRSSGTVVTVIEGRVAVLEEARGSSGQPPAAPAVTNPPEPHVTLVSAGEQLTVTAQSARKNDHANVAGATAWTQRQLVFEGATLSDVAEEFNRYNERPLVIEDPDLYRFHISGVFSSTDPESLIRFLRTRPGVEVTETPSEVRVTKIFPTKG